MDKKIMNTLLTTIFSKVKEYLAILGAGILAYLGYKFISQEKQIETLKQENASANADNVVKENQGEVNVIEQQTKDAQTVLDASSADLQSNELELAKLRANRPKE